MYFKFFETHKICAAFGKEELKKIQRLKNQTKWEHYNKNRYTEATDYFTGLTQICQKIDLYSICDLYCIEICLSGSFCNCIIHSFPITNSNFWVSYFLQYCQFKSCSFLKQLLNVNAFQDRDWSYSVLFESLLILEVVFIFLLIF